MTKENKKAKCIKNEKGETLVCYRGDCGCNKFPPPIHQPQKPDWEKELKETFSEYANHKRLREPAFIIWLESFIKDLLETQRREIEKEIQFLIAEECNIARSEGQPTSRLTSLAMKIYKLLDEKYSL